jgi:hypothetical protein
MRRQSGGIVGGSRSSTYGSAGRQTGTSSSSYGYTQGTYADNSQSAEHGNPDDYEEYEENEDDHGQSGSQHGGSTSWNSRSSHSSYVSKKPLNSNYESIDQQFRHYPKKRDVSSGYSVDHLCKSLTCVNVRCVVGPLSKNTEAFVALRTRMVAHTLNKVTKLCCCLSLILMNSQSSAAWRRIRGEALNHGYWSHHEASLRWRAH